MGLTSVYPSVYLFGMRSHEIDPKTINRAVYRESFGAVRVYTRRHINGCQFTSRDQQHCPCPKWIYSKPKGGKGRRESATTPSFAEACEKARTILRGFNPEEIARRKTNAPVVVPTIDEVLTRYFSVLGSRKLSENYLKGLPAYFVRRPAPAPGSVEVRERSGGGAGRRAVLNPSLLDFLDRYNITLAEPITRMDQISSNLLDDWRASWRSNDLTCKQWKTISNSFFKWAVERRYLDRRPVFGERLRIRKGNRCGYFPDEQYEKLIRTLPFSTPDNISPAANYVPRLRAFVELGRWAGLAVVDIVRFAPAKSISPDNVLTYRRAKNGQIAVVLLDPAVAARLRAIPLEPGCSAEQPFRFPKQAERPNTSRWRDRFKALCAKAGISEIETEHGEVREPHPHMLRDTFAIDAITRGVTLQHVSKMLGHASIEITQRAYLFWVQKRLDYCIEDQRAALARRADLAAAAEAEDVAAVPQQKPTLLQ